MSTTDRTAGANALPMPRPGEPPRPRVPVPERWTLPNGLRVIALARPGLPQVAVRLAVGAGAVDDPAETPGVAALTGALLTEGTHRHSAEELNARLDLLGASLGVHVGHDFVDIDLVLLSETLRPGLELLAEVVTRPAFPEREVERVRAEMLDALDARRDEPANRADDEASRAVFGDHPYGRLAAGTPEGLRRIDIPGLSAFHAAHYHPESSFLVVAGDFEAMPLLDLLEGTFGRWRRGSQPRDYPEAPGAAPGAGRIVRIAWPEAAQGEIRLAGLGLTRSSPEWIPAAVANYILGGSTITGRLGANLREDKGWTYGVRSGFSAARQRGGWAVETAVDVEVVEAAVAEIRAELERFVSHPVSAEELRRAKDAMILSLPRAFESPARIVGRFAVLEAYGLPENYWERFPEAVEAVTAEAVLEVARRYFDPGRLVTVVVGYPEE